VGTGSAGDHHSLGRSGWRRLRARTNAVDEATLLDHLGPLIPRYVEWEADRFQPTFEELLVSSMDRRVVAIVNAVLAVLGARFRANPDVDSFALSDLVSVGVKEIAGAKALFRSHRLRFRLAQLLDEGALPLVET